jgi:aryl-alcohol dehydrogenase-like predicted oxidoreductase
MHYRPLGNTGLVVSSVGFGAWQLANPAWGGPDEAESVRLVHAALDAGCNFFDTAPNYGDGASETVLGRALRGRRDRAVVCTKFGHTGPDTKDFSVGRLRPALEGSLRRLRTDHVDVLLLHNPPADRLDRRQAAGLYDELTRLQGEGRLRAFGASVDWSHELRALAATTPGRAAEVLFNAFHQEPRAAFPEAARLGLGLIAKVPLDSGWLSGRYDEHSRFDGVRARWQADVIARRAALVRRLRSLLPAGLPLARAALGFVLSHPEIATTIPGVKSRVQLEANLQAGDEPLPAPAIAAIHALGDEEAGRDPLPW